MSAIGESSNESELSRFDGLALVLRLAVTALHGLLIGLQWIQRYVLFR